MPSNTQTYTVARDFPQNGRAFRKGDPIELTERQARYLLINGFLKKPEPVKPPAKQQLAADKPEAKGSK